MKVTRSEPLRIEALVYVLCDLKVCQPDLLRKAKFGELQYADLILNYSLDDDDDRWYIRWLRYCFDEGINANDPEWQGLTQSIAMYTFGSPKKLSLYFANEVVDRINV